MSMMPYNEMSPAFSETHAALMPILAFYSAFVGVAMLLGFVAYILRGVAILKMSENRGISHGWLGFIPFAHNFQLGEVAGEIEIGNKRVKNTGMWLLILPIIYGVVFAIGYAIMLVPYVVTMVSYEGAISQNEVMGAVSNLLVSCIVFVIVILVVQIVVFLFKYLALHKIFSQYSEGQKPVFYLILSMFVPFAEAILLFMHSNRSMLTPGETIIDVAGEL